MALIQNNTSQRVNKTVKLTASPIAAFKCVKIAGDDSTNLVPQVSIVTTSIDNPLGITMAALSASTLNFVLKEGRLQVTGFNTLSSAVGANVYMDATGSPTLSVNSKVIGKVLTLNANGTVLFDFGGGTGSGGGGSSSTYTNSKLNSLEIDGVTNTINTDINLNTIALFTTNLKLLAVNRNTVSAKIRIAHIDGNLASVAPEDYVFYDALLLPGETKQVIIPGASASDTFLVRSDITSISFSLFSEIQTGTSYYRLAAFDIDGFTNTVNTNWGIYTTGVSNNTDFKYIVCNRNSAVSSLYRLAAIDGTTVASLGNDDYILWEQVIAPNETQSSDNFLHLDASKTIMFRSDTTNVNILVYGNLQ